MTMGSKVSSALHRGLLFTVAMLSVTASAQAQPQPEGTATPAAQSPVPPPAPAGDLARAKVEYESGRTLFRSGDYAGALVKLRRSFELSGDPRVLWNMIVCEKQLRHYAKMQPLILRYLKDGGSLLTEAEQEEARRLLGVVQRFVSTLKLEVSPPGASISIDGEPLGLSPLRSQVLVDLGARKLRVTKARYRDWSQTLQVTGAGELTVRVNLEALPERAQLVVSGPRGSTIILDDKRVGTQSWGAIVPSGIHQLRVTAPHSKPYRTELLLRDGETRRLIVTLETERTKQLWWWVAGGTVLAGALVGGYVALKPHGTEPPTHSPTGTLGTVEW